MRTAQEAYDEFVREGLRPRLRDLGFAGSGTTFRWPSPTTFAHIGLQKSAYSDRKAVKFTANVTVVDKRAWEEARALKSYLPKAPAPNRFYGSFAWQERIGRLLPDGQDQWWELNAEQDWRPLVEEVVDAISTFVIPELARRAAP